MHMNTFKLADIFRDRMVLQHGKQIAVFGEAKGDGEIVFNGNSTFFTANGTFTVYLPEAEPGGPYDMTIRFVNESVVLHDIFVGDVFLAGGQSNMELTLDQTFAYENELASEACIRYYEEPHQADDDMHLYMNAPEWKLFTPESEPSFSAVAYYFALKYHRITGIPVGIVSCNKGASRVDAWTSSDIVSRPDYQSMIKKHHRDMEEYRFNIGQWLYYNKLIPIVPYTLKAVLWYQGESNRLHEEAVNYDVLFRFMVNNWRTLWHEELPFYTVQIMPFDEPETDADWTAIRMAEVRAAASISGVRLVTLFNTGEEKQIHPTKKKCVGEALASAVLSDYGDAEEYSGPVNAICNFENDHVRVRFDHAKKLEIRGDKLQDTWLYVSDGHSELIRKPALARIEKNELILYTRDMDNPVKVEMGCRNAPKHNLYNEAGFLASPFMASKHHVRIQDIADYFNVSKTTVSRALANKGRISTKLKNRIIDYAMQSGYRADKIHREDIAKSGNIGVIMPADMVQESGYFQKCICGIAETAEKAGYHLLIALEKDNEIRTLRELTTNGKCDGYILMRTYTNNRQTAFLKEQGEHFVVTGNPEDPSICQVDGNTETAVRDLTRYLFNIGYQHIAYVGGLESFTVNRERYNGYIDGYDGQLIHVEPELIFKNICTEQEIEAVLDKLVQSNVDCIMAGDDVLSVKILKALTFRGIYVPYMIGLVSCYGSFYTEGTWPAITAMYLNGRKIGEIACEKLLKLMRGEKPEKCTLVDHELWKRYSLNERSDS